MDREVIGYALLDNGSDTTLIRSDALSRLHLRRRSGPLTKKVSGTSGINSVDKALQALPMDESESADIKRVAYFNELPIAKPFRKLPEMIRRRPH